MTFASPGYGFADGSGEDRMSNFWNVRDPILDAAFIQDNDGFETTIVHNLDDRWPLGGGNIADDASIHSMALYNGFVQLLQRHGYFLDDLVSATGLGQRFSSIHANVRVIDEARQLFQIGGDADVLVGDRYANLMLGGAADDELYGKGGADNLHGGDDRDQLYGGAGSDTVAGGYGFDKLWGGGEVDVFDFNDYRETNSQNIGDRVDLIIDFGVGGVRDIIDLRDIDANWNLAGNDNFVFIGSARFQGTSGELRFKWNAAGTATVVMGDLNGDGIADFSISLRGLHTLAGTDFIL